jgi:hypothetical protein
LTDQIPNWSLAHVRAEVEPLRERARSTATLVVTFTTAVLGGLLVNARTGTLTRPASTIAVIGAGFLAAAVLGLLIASTTNTVNEELDLQHPVRYVEKVSDRIAAWTRWSLRGVGVALGFLVVATGWDQVRPQVEQVRVVLDESMASSVAACDGGSPVLVGTARTAELDDPGDFLTIHEVTAPCGEWGEPSGSARLPAGSIVAILPLSADRPEP